MINIDKHGIVEVLDSELASICSGATSNSVKAETTFNYVCPGIHNPLETNLVCSRVLDPPGVNTICLSHYPANTVCL